MCLYTKTNEPKIAEQDITCYKVMMVMETPIKDVYRTPFQDKIVSIDVINGNKPYVANCKGTAKRVVNSWKEYSIDEGFIHTIRDLDDAKWLYKHINEYWVTSNTPVLFSCKIPKGTKYFEGHDSNLKSGFSSEQIVFQEKLTDF